MKVALGAVLLPVALAAQDFAWKLPPRGGARYERDLHTDGAGTQKQSNWDAWRDPGLVLAGELDGAGVHLLAPFVDLRDVVARAGLDGGRVDPGKATLSFAGNRDCEPFELEVTYGPVDDGGDQELQWTVRPARNADRPKGPPRATVSGSGGGSRRLDRDRGVVAALQGHAELELTRPQASAQPFAIDDRWTLQAVMAPEDPEFRAAVQAGIDAAVDALQQQVRRRLGQGPAATDLDGGELALVLLALVKGVRDRSESLLQNGFDELRGRDLRSTYSLAVALVALEGLYAPADEIQQLRAGALRAPAPRHPTARDAELIGMWTQRLLGNVDGSVDAKKVRRWSYGPAQTWDNSNSNYAALGLYAAQLCGADLPAEIWSAAARHWLDCAIATDHKGVPQIVTHVQLAQGKVDPRATASRTTATGWGYAAGDAPTGSMTTGAVSALQLCRAGLGQKGGAIGRKIDDAILRGMLWLQLSFTVRSNPGPTPTDEDWPFYYLYGLERACELQQVARVGDRDWYFEGALQLLGQQRRNGSWGDERDTCFALLFLKKAAVPVLTGR